MIFTKRLFLKMLNSLRPFLKHLFYTFIFKYKIKLMKFLFPFLIGLISFISFGQKNIHHRWNNQLQEFVSETGLVNYKAWKKNQNSLDAYINTLSNNPPRDGASKNYKLAYWINAYNSLTIKLILENYPLKSIKEIESPWNIKCFNMEGNNYSLGEIEHKILRKMGESRIHFAINCASISCPKLLNKAYQEKKIESQLVSATSSFLLDPSKNVLTNKKLSLSKIFFWFKKDFGSKKERLDFIKKYSNLKFDKPIINYLDYDWSLNKR